MSAPSRSPSPLAIGLPALLGVLTGLNLLDSADSSAFALLGPDIQRSLRLSDTALGVVATLGAACFVVAAIPIGLLADRYRRTAIAAVCAAAAAACTVLTGAVGAVWQLVLVRLLNGVGQSSTLPVHSSLLADGFPLARRAGAFGVHNAAAPTAALLSPVTVGAIASAAGGVDGWRVAFVAVGLPAAAVAAACFLVRDPPRGGRERGAMGGPHSESADVPVAYHAAVERLLSIPSFRLLLAAVGVLGFVIVAVPTFLNVLLKDAYHLGALARGVVVSLTEAGSVLGVIAGGVIGDRLLARRPESAMVALGGAFAGFGAVFCLALGLPGLIAVVIGLTAAKVLLAAGSVPVYAIVGALAPYRLRSLAYALLGLSIFVLGGFLGGVIAGALSDAHGPRIALVAVTLPASLAAAALVSGARRHLADDLASAAAELVEDQAQDVRLARARTDNLAVPVLQVRNLIVSYAGQRVLHGVDLELAEGEVLALLGTNGAGKSTVLKALSGLVPVERGVVRFRGRAVTFADPAARVALGLVQMPGGRATFSSLSVLDNLVAGGHTFGWDRTRLGRRIDEVLERFPALASRLAQPAGSLSGGEQQMLALAKALLLDPTVLLIDELSLGLAPVAVQGLIDVLDTLRSDGVSMVLVEQSVNLALTIADRAVFLDKGEVSFEGAGADLLERDDILRSVFLGGARG